MRSKNNLQGVRSIVSRVGSHITRIIRSRKIFVIGLVTALLIVAFAVKTTYSEGSCQKQSSIKIIDETGGNDSQIAFTGNGEVSPFKNYVTTMSKYTFNKIDEIGQCKGDLNSDPQVELIFVYRPMISNGIAPFEFKQMKSNNTVYLNSPWVKLMITRSPKLLVRAAFIWNQRQFLFDQAVLAGVPAPANVPLLPMDISILGQFQPYRDNIYSTILSFKSSKEYIELESSKQTKANALANLSKRYPPDLTWLLLHSSNFDGKLLYTMAMYQVFSQQLESYIDLTKSLLNRRFALREAEQHYQNILDLKDAIDINKYRIDKIRYH
jgi:hypothetical protein